MFAAKIRKKTEQSPLLPKNMRYFARFAPILSKSNFI